jgi:hypothetical protein
MASECGNMTYVSAKPNEDLVIAGIALKGLWGSTDGGTSWHQLGSGHGSAKIINRPGSIIYDPARPNVFWQSGIYNGNGIYRTDNNGKVFRALGSIGHNDTVSVISQISIVQPSSREGTNKDKRIIALRMAATRGQTWESIFRRARPFPVIRW